MNPILEFFTGTNGMTDQVVAMDLLISAKSGVRNYAMAVTEVASPEIKATLAKHLDEAIDFHERVSQYMIDHKLYHPWNVNEQIRLDLQNMDTAIDIAEM